MPLTNRNYPPMYEHTGSFDLAAGQELELKTSEEELIEETVPEGKKWTVSVGVKITEEDV